MYLKNLKNPTKIQKVHRKTPKIQNLSEMVKKLENPKKSQEISKIHFFSIFFFWKFFGHKKTQKNKKINIQISGGVPWAWHTNERKSLCLI